MNDRYDWGPTAAARALALRTFETGANRNTLDGKLRYEGSFSPLVLQARAEYMRQHNEGVREPDNWQLGIDRAALMDSALRHVMDWWLAHRGNPSREGMQAAICGLMFNAEAYLHAVLTEGESAK